MAAAVRAVLEQQLLDHWLATPVVLENQAFDPAAPGDGFPPGGPFLALGLQWRGQQQIGFGADTVLYRTTGTALIHVRVPLNQGTAVAERLADQVAALYRGQYLGPATCWSAQVQGGVVEAGGWYRLTVAVPFTADQVM